MRFAQFRILPVALAGCAAACLCGCNKPKPAPSIDELSAALQQSADKALAAPSLANEQVILAAQPGKIDAQAAEVIESATAAGGVGLRSLNAQGQVSILATIPENNAEAFKAALQHQKTPMNTPSPTTTLIEVLIATPAASPTP